MVTHPRERLAAGPGLPASTSLLAAAGDGTAAAAVAAGADLIDLGGADAETVTRFRHAHPGVMVCADTGPADLVRDRRAALAADALLRCPDAAVARASGLPPERLVVEVAPGAIAAARAAGWVPLVDADRAAAQLGQVASVAAIVAIAALSCWTGAGIVATRHVLEVRRALDMTASIAGTRPPAMALRGLA
jgi:dihydropteroate synthase